MTARGITAALVLCAAALALPLPVAGLDYPAPAHDPSIAKEGEWYYLFSTGPGITVQRSRDLVSWQLVGSVFRTPPAWTYKEVPRFDGTVWAPDISEVNGRWYLYYAISSFGSNQSCIGLAVSAALDPKSPDYRWEDQGKVIGSLPRRDDWNAIDPNIAHDDAGYCLVFGSFWDGIKMTPIDPSTGKPKSDPPEILSVARRAPGVSGDPIEAPFIFRHADYFYLFVSYDFCCRGIRSDYKIAVGRSTQITGPYSDRDGTPMTRGGGTVVLEGSGDVHGPGHNAALHDGDKDWLVHHMYDGKRGGMAVLQVRPLTWSDDGWPVAGPALEARKP
ncbi:MAG TPA: arabinan endo-1,5-alpha-L-arabinosidase [Spirochaetia bacterium]|nr:arabinan endo-1,5-alpha-L-arabinosidase [Spirochaetia bacterium]